MPAANSDRSDHGRVVSLTQLRREACGKRPLVETDEDHLAVFVSPLAERSAWVDYGEEPAGQRKGRHSVKPQIVAARQGHLHHETFDMFDADFDCRSECHATDRNAGSADKVIDAKVKCAGIGDLEVETAFENLPDHALSIASIPTAKVNMTVWRMTQGGISTATLVLVNRLRPHARSLSTQAVVLSHRLTILALR